MGKLGKTLFQDEPEETCNPRLKVPRLFGDEPEEWQSSSSATGNRSSVGLTSIKPKPATLFGDEGDEVPRVPRAPPPVEDASDDDGEAPQPATLNLDWSAMKLFAHASFLQKQVAQSKPEREKRCYDNSKRAEKASSKLKIASTSFKDMALQPGRLETLAAKGECKCASVENLLHRLRWEAKRGWEVMLLLLLGSLAGKLGSQAWLGSHAPSVVG